MRLKLPAATIIAPAKLSHYLLVPQAKGDKSRFLALAGYNPSTADQLLDDLRTQVLPCEAVELQTTRHGVYFEICSGLLGPNGRSLSIRTIWMKEHLSGRTKFVTLIPRKKPSP